MTHGTQYIIILMITFHHKERTHNGVIRGKRHRWGGEIHTQASCALTSCEGHQHVPFSRSEKRCNDLPRKHARLSTPKAFISGWSQEASSDWKLTKFQTLRGKLMFRINHVVNGPYRLTNSSNAKFPDTRGQPCKQDFPKIATSGKLW